MVLNVYKGIYGVPAKCGSRFFSKTISYWGKPDCRSFREFYLMEFTLEYIIIRNPIEHLKSGLQTEIMECYDDTDRIYNILTLYTEQFNGGSHFYYKFCEKVYEVWYKTNYKLKVVDLSNLSEFMETIFEHIPYNESEYDFNWNPHYVSKEDVWNRCISLYPDLMDKLIQYTTNDTKYYNALMNDDRSFTKFI